MIGITHLQNFIASYPDDWREKLSGAPYHIKIEYHPEEHAYIFNYNMITSDLSDKKVQESRGIILDADTFDVRCRAFDKFFNFHETCADKRAIEFGDKESRPVVMEKVDGSIIKLSASRRALGKDWVPYEDMLVSTNGSIDAHDASIPIPGKYSNFGEVVDSIFASLDETFHFNSEYTYIFELVGPQNRVVVPYKETTLYYIGRRHNVTGAETLVYKYYESGHRTQERLAHAFNVPTAYPFTDQQAVMDKVACLPWTQEGFVVAREIEPGHVIRVKMKGSEYLAAHRLRGENIPTPKRILDMILQGNADDFVGYFPEYKEQVEEVRGQLTSYIQRILDDVREMFVGGWTEVDRKTFAVDFANAINGRTRPSILFQLKNRIEKGEDVDVVQALGDVPDYVGSIPLDALIKEIQKENV